MLRVKVLGGVMAAVALAGACGGGGGKQSLSAPSSTTSVVSATTKVNGMGMGAASRCADAAMAMSRAALALAQAYNGQGGDLKASVATLDAFAGDAPSGISGDIKTVSGAYARVAQVLEDAHYDPAGGQPPAPATIAKLNEATAGLSTDEVKGASQRVSAWFAGGCK